MDGPFFFFFWAANHSEAEKVWAAQQIWNNYL